LQGVQQAGALGVGGFVQATASACIALAGHQDVVEAFGAAQGIAALQQAHQGGG
jgi:hypothetical protein